MTPHEQHFIDVAQSSGDQIIANLDDAHIPTTLALAITAYITTTLLERLPRDMRRGIATALIARLAQGRRLDA